MAIDFAKLLARARLAATKFRNLPAWLEPDDLAQQGIVEWLTARSNCVWPITWFWRRQATWLRRNAWRSVPASELEVEPRDPRISSQPTLAFDSQLSARNKIILDLRLQGLTLREIASTLRLSEGRVSQILKAIAKSCSACFLLACLVGCTTLQEFWQKAEPHVIGIASEIAIEKIRDSSAEIRARLDDQIAESLAKARPELRELAREATIKELQDYETRLVKRIEEVKDQGFSKESARKTAGVAVGVGILSAAAAVLRARRRRKA